MAVVRSRTRCSSSSWAACKASSACVRAVMSLRAVRHWRSGPAPRDCVGGGGQFNGAPFPASATAEGASLTAPFPSGGAAFEVRHAYRPVSALKTEVAGLRGGRLEHPAAVEIEGILVVSGNPARQRVPTRLPLGTQQRCRLQVGLQIILLASNVIANRRKLIQRRVLITCSGDRACCRRSSSFWMANSA